MLRAKFLISLALIAAIQQFYAGPSAAMATVPVPSCTQLSSADDNDAQSNEANVMNTGAAMCPDTAGRLPTVVADKA